MKWLYAIAAFVVGAGFIAFAAPALLNADAGSAELTNALLACIAGLLAIISGQMAVQRRTLKIKTNKKD